MCHQAHYRWWNNCCQHSILEAMKIKSLAEYIDNRLELKLFEHLDASMNGLQVGRPEKEVKKIAFSVDSTLETFLKAAQWGADALFVHHGLFWGKPLAITKNHYNRIATLLRYDIALLAAHLPLDAHPELGNNATMASMLELQELESFGYYHGVDIGYAKRFNEAVSVEHIVKTLGFTDEGGLKILPFGKKEIKSVGIVSGGAASQVLEAIEKGFDAFITGEC